MGSGVRVSPSASAQRSHSRPRGLAAKAVLAPGLGPLSGFPSTRRPARGGPPVPARHGTVPRRCSLVHQTVQVEERLTRRREDARVVGVPTHGRIRPDEDAAESTSVVPAVAAHVAPLLARHLSPGILDLRYQLQPAASAVVLHREGCAELLLCRMERERGQKAAAEAACRCRGRRPEAASNARRASRNTSNSVWWTQNSESLAAVRPHG